ncbi:MAG: efflux RND transporter periplasmic adaptor subunit [Desulfobacterales bacterium]|nr:efflux RND transporter periplasmic adaptor subunit [Desulfobacterales bacterium]
MKKIFISLIIILFVGFLGMRIYEKAFATKQDIKPKSRGSSIAVEVAPIIKSNIQEIRNFTGSLYSNIEYVLAPKISGRVKKIFVNIGNEVKGGQLVAVMDDDEYLQQVQQTNAELDVAKANLQESENTLENSKREYERALTLRKNKIISDSQLDSAESEYKTQQAKLKVAAAQVSQKEAALMMANLKLSYAQIKVPENNTAVFQVIGERFVDEGALLSVNTPVVSVIDIGKLIAVIHVIEKDYTKIKIGLPAVISTDAFLNQTFTGKVIRIAPLMKEKSREARVEIEVPNPNKLLKPGMFVRVVLQFEEHKNTTIIPTAALAKRNGSQGFFLVDAENKKANFIQASIGIVNNTQAEILSPSATGKVVTIGHHLLEDGALIMIPNEKNENKNQGQ